MSKYALFGLCVLWLVLCTFFVNLIVAYDPAASLIVYNPVGVFESGDGGYILQSVSLMSTFFNALAFRIDGLPVILNLFFQVPTAIIGVITLQFIVDLIPG